MVSVSFMHIATLKMRIPISIFKVLYFETKYFGGGRPRTSGCLPVSADMPQEIAIETGPTAHIAVACHRASATWNKQHKNLTLLTAPKDQIVI